MPIERGSLNDMLEGGYIESYELDIRTKLFSCQIEVLENDELHQFALEARALSFFSFEDEVVHEWPRLQISSATIDKGLESSASEEWHLELGLWDLAMIRLSCAQLLLDGEQLV